MISNCSSETTSPTVSRCSSVATVITCFAIAGSRSTTMNCAASASSRYAPSAATTSTTSVGAWSATTASMHFTASTTPTRNSCKPSSSRSARTRSPTTNGSQNSSTNSSACLTSPQSSLGFSAWPSSTVSGSPRARQNSTDYSRTTSSSDAAASRAVPASLNDLPMMETRKLGGIRPRAAERHSRSVDRAAAEDWVRAHVEPVGAIETAHERPWATVLRVPLADSVAWFKACAPVQTFEPRLTADLFSRWPDRVQLRHFASRFAELCDDLAAYDVPETIQHDDLHHANLYVQDSSMRVLDWGDASISHPFASLV